MSERSRGAFGENGTPAAAGTRIAILSLSL